MPEHVLFEPENVEYACTASLLISILEKYDLIVRIQNAAERVIGETFSIRTLRKIVDEIASERSNTNFS